MKPNLHTSKRVGSHNLEFIDMAATCPLGNSPIVQTISIHLAVSNLQSYSKVWFKTIKAYAYDKKTAQGSK